MALVVLTDAAVAQNSRTLTWTIPTLAVGDVVVVTGIQWDTADTLNLPTGTGLSFTQRVNIAATGKQRHYIWTAVATSGGTNVVVTATASATASIHTGALYLCPTADGYSLAATPNVASGTANTSTPQLALAGTSGNLGIWTLGDWDASTTAPTYLNSATQDYYVAQASFSTQLSAHNDLTGASTTLGVSAPTMAWTIAAIEVIKSAPPPTVVTPLKLESGLGFLLSESRIPIG